LMKKTLAFVRHQLHSKLAHEEIFRDLSIETF